MNVNPGGNQPAMYDTMWDGKVQRMVFPDGKPKEMRRVLEERGIDVSRMKADDMRKKLKEMSDFKYEKTKVEIYITSKGHRCMFIPKYHCELNHIERVWGYAKKYTRSHCDYSFAGLEYTVEPALETVFTDLIRKYFQKVCEYSRDIENQLDQKWRKHSNNTSHIVVYQSVNLSSNHNFIKFLLDMIKKLSCIFHLGLIYIDFIQWL